MSVVGLCRDEVVSAQLKPALIGLNDTLKLLASVLDAVVFRDTWKAIAVAVNRELYNSVATEAKFSLQVSAILAIDALHGPDECCNNILPLFTTARH